MVRALLFLLAIDCQQVATLYELRSVMLKASTYDVQRFTDTRLEELREGWIRWVRPTGSGPVKQKEHLLHGETPDRVESSGDHIYAVRVAVPRKRSLIRENNPVYVGTVEITYEIDGRTRTKEEPVNAWMNPDTSRTIDLSGIADRAHVTVDAYTAKRHAKQALVEIHLQQAVPTDDPANPAYPTIRMLQRLREDPETIDDEIAAVEGYGSLPLAEIVRDLRRADELMRSEKPEDQEKGGKLLKDTLRRLR